MNRFSKIDEAKSKSSVDKDCETCTDFKDWIKSNQSKEKTQASSSGAANEDYYGKCPLFRDQLGRASWSVLHTLAAYYPETPSQQEQTSMQGFIHSFAQFFPCRECASDFREEYKFIFLFGRHSL